MSAGQENGGARRSRAARRDARGGDRFQLEGEFWAIAYAGRTVHLRATRGLEYLARLLARPGTPVAAVEIAANAGAPGDDDPRVRERARIAVTKGIAAALRRIERVHPDLGRHLGATIRRGYVCIYVPDPRVPIRWRT